MCTILVAWRAVPEAPLILAANRDELMARATGDPRLISEQPRTAGGVDLVAGGTWMAVGAAARVSALTNRNVELRDPARRSRGELPLRLLAAAGDEEVERVMTGLDPHAYNACNLMHASRDRALVAHITDAPPRLVDLEPGAHVLTTVDVDQPGDAKVARLRAGMEAAMARSHPALELLQRLERLLQGHGPDRIAGPEAACIHGDVYGTRSSSSVVLWADGRVTYRHAAGRPCVTPRVDVSRLLA